MRMIAQPIARSVCEEHPSVQRRHAGEFRRGVRHAIAEVERGGMSASTYSPAVDEFLLPVSKP
jgi:hypothetical protein